MRKSLELFAGAGGMALGLESAGFEPAGLVELDPSAVNTLRNNRPKWPVEHKSVTEVDYSKYRGVWLLAGGFPCQSFSYAGRRKGLKDPRGGLVNEFIKAVKECVPCVVLAENVKGLLKHDRGNTMSYVVDSLKALGYEVEYKVLDASLYNVPQKRERLIIAATRLKKPFKWPEPSYPIPTLRTALVDVPGSLCAQYSQSRKEVLRLVPPGGCWRDLPEDIQKQYLGKSYYQGGGKTGIAKRLSWDKPAPTLTCSPSQKRTERCHPDFTRPLTVREYARVQTFPDSWVFSGSMSNQYKQIGNAVPVNLAKAIGGMLQSH